MAGALNGKLNKHAGHASLFLAAKAFGQTRGKNEVICYVPKSSSFDGRSGVMSILFIVNGVANSSKKILHIKK